MLFSSWQFICVFLPVTLFIFALLPAKPLSLRKIWLTVVSFFFYGYWKVEYVPLLIISILFNYAAAELIVRFRHHRAARVMCVLAVTANLLLLGYYKYANFFAQSLVWIFPRAAAGVHFDIILPLAISFFTFTQICYVVDVYRNQSLHYRPLDYVLFVVFFPHLIAGPIVRHWEIIPQYDKNPMTPDMTDHAVGLTLFVIGLGKKILLADQLAPYVSSVYGAAGAGQTVSWFDAWFGTLAFALQIYFDFSGYSDMAIGLARLFGIRFPMNFNSPYKSTSINEFWMRWHISLTRFLREYLYFPLGGNRCGPFRHALNILITMLLSGLWHGAGWTYVIWGGLNGFYLVIAHRSQALYKYRSSVHARWYRLISWTLTFNAVLVAWVFFRAVSLGAARNLLTSMFLGHGWTLSEKVTNPARFPGWLFTRLGVHFIPPVFSVPSYDTLFQITALALLLAIFSFNSQELLALYFPVIEKLTPPPRWRLRLTWPAGICLGAFGFLIVHGFYTTSSSPFLYFNF